MPLLMQESISMRRARMIVEALPRPFTEKELLQTIRRTIGADRHTVEKYRVMVLEFAKELGLTVEKSEGGVIA